MPDYTDLDDDELVEFSAFTRRALTVIRAVSAPHGFNLGINAGSAAGAGIAEHLHQHVVPAVGRRLELHAGDRPDEGAAAVARRHPPAARAGLVTRPDRRPDQHRVSRTAGITDSVAARRYRW